MIHPKAKKTPGHFACVCLCVCVNVCIYPCVFIQVYVCRLEVDFSSLPYHLRNGLRESLFV